MDKTIRITGKAKVSAPPDRTRIIIEISKVIEDYNEAMTYAVNATNEMTGIVTRAGFHSSDLKTLSWNIETSYEYYSDEHNNHNKRFAGYAYSHKFVVEFDMESKRIGDILNEIIDSQLVPEVRIEYVVSDVERYREELLITAIEDSRHKAEVIAKASDVKLEEIISIDYSWGQLSTVRNQNQQVAIPSYLKARSSLSAPDITPADVDITDSITIVWALK